MRLAPQGTVRGNIHHYINKHKSKLSGPVLEVGSRLPTDGAWWANNRGFYDGEWIGVDQADGNNVDQVEDVEGLTFDDHHFGAVLCSEVLEHVYRPHKAIDEIYRVLKPGGWAIITTLTAFHIHGYPDDYWRFTPSCIKRLMGDAGFKGIETESAGEVILNLNNCGENDVVKTCPVHVFAVGYK